MGAVEANLTSLKGHGPKIQAYEQGRANRGTGAFGVGMLRSADSKAERATARRLRGPVERLNIRR